MKMDMVVLEEPGRFVLREHTPPRTVEPGQALVRVHRVGVCGTDLHAFRGEQPFFTYPRILGHELGVEVIALGPEAPENAPPVGSRCAVEPYLNCGHCIACRVGKTNCCVRLQTLGVHTDGGMREQFIIPATKLHPSDTLSYDQLALVEMLGIGAHAVRRAALEPNEWVLVIGAGPIGLSVIQFATLASARVIVLDLDPHRLAFCRDHLGVTQTVNAREDPLGTITALTDGDLPTAVFDATGSVASMNGAIRYVASGGRLIFVGLTQKDVSFAEPELHRKELTVLASRNATASDLTGIIRQIETGKIDTVPWITHRAPLAAVPDEFAGWLQPEARVIKAMVSIIE